MANGINFQTSTCMYEMECLVRFSISFDTRRGWCDMRKFYEIGAVCGACFLWPNRSRHSKTQEKTAKKHAVSFSVNMWLYCLNCGCFLLGLVVINGFWPSNLINYFVCCTKCQMRNRIVSFCLSREVGDFISTASLVIFALARIQFFFAVCQNAWKVAFLWCVITTIVVRLGQATTVSWVHRIDERLFDPFSQPIWLLMFSPFASDFDAEIPCVWPLANFPHIPIIHRLPISQITYSAFA